VLGEVKRFFRPEFINRLDGIIVFRPLTREHLLKIVDLKLKDLAQKLEEQGITLEVSDEAKELLAESGYDPFYGARPLERVIREELEDELANRIIDGELGEGELVRIDVQDGKFTFERVVPEPIDAST
jgi:ATP-dependent Clp protease ATP-binding subunit ClpC